VEENMTSEGLSDTAEGAPRLFMRATTRALEGQLKEGQIGGFTIYCDESERVGGSGTAPSPLQYLFLSVGFCMLTQLRRNSEAMGVELIDAGVEVTGRLARSGDVLAGTAQHGVAAVEIDVSIRSEAPAEQISELVRRSEAMCFVTQAVKHPVQTTLTARLNSESLAIGEA
jgi:uncharacterized OsmC-like protein